MADETYTCAACGGVFEKGWSDEEALAEAAEVFPDWGGPMDVVCDDCWNKMREDADADA